MVVSQEIGGLSSLAANETRKIVKVTYRKNVKAGAASAELDQDFLKECFVNNGTVDELANIQSNASIVLGRVGSGKSAALQFLEENFKTHRIDPQEFSLSYIENSDAIQLLSELGVNLDNLFQALWKHVLTVELIRAKYVLDGKSGDLKFWNKVFRPASTKSAEKAAIDYFDEFGGTEFWQTTETRVKEIIKRIDQCVESEVGSDVKTIRAKVAAKLGVSDQERSEIIQKCNTAVNGVQIQKLHQVISMLDEIFSDSSDNYYLLIDDLDTYWASNTIRFRLIRSLIETVKRFRKVRTAKIVVALRTDLLDTVIRETRDSGFQEEKYEDYFQRIHWTPSDIIEVVDQRIRKVFKDQYTRSDVGFYDIFPEKIGSEYTQNYFVERTALRPRDAIIFLNRIFEELAGKTAITKRIVQEAEKNYSEGRFSSLCEEWSDRYPNLESHLSFLKGMPSRFLLSEVPIERVNAQIMEYMDCDPKDELTEFSGQFVDRFGEAGNSAQAKSFLSAVFTVLQQVGAIGAKFDATGRPEWTSDRIAMFNNRRFELDTQIYVHPMLFRTLGIKPVGKAK
jgi:hypothetical protein